MNGNNSVPNIRFKGFEDKWKINRLLSITTVYSGLTYKPEDIQTSGTLVLRSSNIQEGKIIKKDCVYVNSSVVNSINVEKKDVILVVRNGSKKLIGKHAIVMQNMKNTVIGAFMSGLRPKNGDFLNALLNTETFKKEVFRSLGATINQITNKDLKRMKFYLPFSYEQQKIGNLFTKLDKLLDLQQQKIDKLELLKKTLLQKLFPKHDAKIPELRYREFEDNWIICSFSGLLIKNSSKNKNLEVENIESISNKNGFTKQSEQFDGYRVASLDLSNYYVIKGNQFAYNPSRINVGSIAYKRKGEKDSIISPLYVSFSTKNNINDIFLWYWFRTSSFKKQRIQFSEGGVRDTLPFENLKKMRIKLPRLNEQQKIGNLLSKVDQLIELENQKLQNFQQVKKCLLQNMFVE